MTSEVNVEAKLRSQPRSSYSHQQEALEQPHSWSLEMLRKLRAIEINQDDKFANIMGVMGEFGTFQQRLVALTFIPNLLLAVFLFADIFTFTEQKPYCNTSWILAVGPNLSEAEQLNLTLPRDANGSFRTCLMYLPVTWDLDSIIQFGLNYTQSCSNGWIYPESKRRSVTDEFDLVCNEELTLEAVHTTILAGLLIGSLIFGFISDKLGRYPSIMLSILEMIIFGFGTAFVNSFHQYLFFRFAVSQALVGYSISSVSLATEWLVGEHRAHSLILEHCFCSLGIILLTGLAYSLPHWRLLFLVGGAPVFYLICYSWILPESPRWLMMKGKVEEAKQVLCYAAGVNKKTIPLSLLNKLQVPGKKVTKASVLDFYNNRHLRKVTLVMGCVWFTAGQSCYTLSLKMRHYGLNLYLSQIIPRVMEVPARLCCIFLLEQFGRKWSLAGTLFQGTIINLLILVFPSELKSTMVLIALLGQFSLAASITVFFVYTAELLPTVLRTTGLGLVTLAWGAGAILSLTLISQSPISSSFSFISAICSLSLCSLLPETLNHPISDSLELYPSKTRVMSEDLSDDLAQAFSLDDVIGEAAKNTILNTTANLYPELHTTSSKAKRKTSRNQDD